MKWRGQHALGNMGPEHTRLAGHYNGLGSAKGFNTLDPHVSISTLLSLYTSYNAKMVPQTYLPHVKVLILTYVQPSL